MARFNATWWGTWTLELDEDETQQLLGAADVATAVSGLGGFAPFPFNLAAGYISAYIAANKAIISRVDKGNGVKLVKSWWSGFPYPVARR